MDSRVYWKTVNVNCARGPNELACSLFFCNPVVDSPPKRLSYGRLASKYELKHSCTIRTRKSQIHQQGSCRASSRSFGMVWERPNSEGEEEISKMKS